MRSQGHQPRLFALCSICLALGCLFYAVSYAATSDRATADERVSKGVPGGDSLKGGPRPKTIVEGVGSSELDAPRCLRPTVAIEKTEACANGTPYPACRWKLPEPEQAGYVYEIWRNTGEEHRWARPSLVALILAAAYDYATLYPGERLAVGDLDAPGPRHETHAQGVDVDLYLPGMMATENEGGGEYVENYLGRGALYVRAMRARVEDLARVLATCTSGHLRVYYNDQVVASRFRRWFERAGLDSPFGRPMQRHNDLHRFHFHVTIAEDVPVLAEAPL